MSRYFEFEMFPVILIGMMALTGIDAGIAMLVVGVGETHRAVGIIPIVCGALLAWVAIGCAMDV